MIHFALVLIAIAVSLRAGLWVLGFITGAGMEAFDSTASGGVFMALIALAAVCIVLAIAL
jgi:hypothetical protein